MVLDTNDWIKRYWQKVKIGGRDECWEWQAGTVKGHGRIHVNGRDEYAHRMAYILAYGDGSIPEGLLVCHTCDNRPCQNPRHLYLGTDGDNIRDAWAKGRLPQPPHVPGELQGQSKLTAKKVLNMRARYTGARGQLTQFAREFHVTKQCIKLIVNRTNWRHI